MLLNCNFFVTSNVIHTTREPVMQFYFIMLFWFYPGLLFSTLLQCYVHTVLYLLLRCYDTMDLITPNYQYKGARENHMYKRNIVTLF